ncbi:hypothetical protein IJG22_00440 [Candidatus Saccharibacteria bacterium]|nr:hypothetical protein [Candidatus Saccharibacteria bacterium]
MFFDDIAQVREIASKCGTAVFVVPDEISIEIPGALVLQPEEKTVITIDQIREMLGRLGLKQNEDLFVVIRPADKMHLAAANAFLKSLEEPGEHVHFVLITSRPSMLLPTIMSRAALYYLRVQDDGVIHADAKVKELAKRLMVAKPVELVGLAEEIAKKKDGVRAYALEIVGTVIEMLYKSYYITSKDVFVKKLPKFLTLYENLAQNGHIKLQIVATLA